MMQKNLFVPGLTCTKSGFRISYIISSTKPDAGSGSSWCFQIDSGQPGQAGGGLANTGAVYIDQVRAASADRLNRDNQLTAGETNMNYTYLLQCADGTLYCGWTNHLEKRVETHNAGKGAKYTKSRRPVILVYYEEYETKSEALRREAAIKKLSRQEKLRMIRQFEECKTVI